jgi:hypothetical protein
LIRFSITARKAKTRKTKINAPWLTTYVLSGAIGKKNSLHSKKFHLSITEDTSVEESEGKWCTK